MIKVKVSSSKRPQILNRYTTLPVLMDMLLHQKLVLLNPKTWEDRNDAHYLERYKAEMGLKSVLALCFSKKRETFHHWKIFSHGTAGVCVEFDKIQLIKRIIGQPGIRFGDVQYSFIKDIVFERPPVEEWPFIKRKPFEDEGELRLIFEDKKKEVQFKDVPIDIASIRRITLGPWMPESVADSVKTVLNRIDGCEKLRIEKSSLLETALWKSALRTRNKSAFIV